MRGGRESFGTTHDGARTPTTHTRGATRRPVCVANRPVAQERWAAMAQPDATNNGFERVGRAAGGCARANLPKRAVCHVYAPRANPSSHTLAAPPSSPEGGRHNGGPEPGPLLETGARREGRHGWAGGEKKDGRREKRCFMFSWLGGEG